MVLFNSSQTRIIVLSSWKGKVHMWPHTQESNHMYVPLAQAFVFMPHTQIDESWNYKKLFHQIFSHNQVHMISKFIVQSVLVQVLSNLFFFLIWAENFDFSYGYLFVPFHIYVIETSNIFELVLCSYFLRILNTAYLKLYWHKPS